MDSQPQNKSEIIVNNDESDNYINISQISTGFIDVPNHTSLNIYVQGCKLNCVGCQNPQSIPFIGGTKIHFDQIIAAVSSYELCDWVCWLGGDATYQPEQFKWVNVLIKQRYNKRICLYTGQSFENIQELLDDVDLVIDGPWMGIPITDKGTNQRIFLRTVHGWDRVDSWDTLKILFSEMG